VRKTGNKNECVFLSGKERPITAFERESAPGSGHASTVGVGKRRKAVGQITGRTLGRDHPALTGLCPAIARSVANRLPDAVRTPLLGPDLQNIVRLS